MTGGKGTNHDQTRAHTGKETLGTELAGHLDETAGGRLTGGALGLVDLGQEGVGGLRDDGGGHTGDETTSQVGLGHLAGSELVLGLAHRREDLFVRDFKAGCQWCCRLRAG